MPDPTDILLKLKTEGDTSGAEAVEKAIAKTGDASEEAAKKTKEVAVNDSEANLRGRAVAWVRVGEGVKQYAKTIGDAASASGALNEQQKQLVRSIADGAEQAGGFISTVAQGFAAGGPAGAAIAAGTSAVGLLASAWAAMRGDQAAADKAAKDAEESFKRLQGFSAKLPLLQQMQEVSELLDAGIEKQLALTKNLAELEKQQRDANTSNALASRKQVVLGDVDSLENDAAGTRNAADVKLAEVEAKVKLAADLASQAAGLAAIAIDNEKKVAALADGDSEKLAKAVVQRDAANAAAEAAQTNLLTVQAAAETEKQKINAEVIKEFGDLRTEARKTISENAFDVIESIEKISKEEGGKIDANAKGALSNLIKLVTDSVPDETQVEAFRQAIQQFRASEDARANGLIPFLDNITKLNAEFQSGLAVRDSAILDLTRQNAESKLRFQAAYATLQAQAGSLGDLQQQLGTR